MYLSYDSRMYIYYTQLIIPILKPVIGNERKKMWTDKTEMSLDLMAWKSRQTNLVAIVWLFSTLVQQFHILISVSKRQRLRIYYSIMVCVYPLDCTDF